MSISEHVRKMEIIKSYLLLNNGFIPFFPGST